MSTLAGGPRGLDPLLLHQSYQMNGGRLQGGHALSNHHADSPVSTKTLSDSNLGQAAEGMQLRSSRRRPRVPDWDSFYKNGQPREQEVIVIEDSPEPARDHALSDYSSIPNGLAAVSSSKKRKLDDTASQSTYSSRQVVNGSSSKGSPTESYRPADRDPHPTASLAHISTNDANSRTGLKRKRTRQNITNGVEPRKLRADGSRSVYGEYRGLGRRATKASDVAVRVVRDVSAIHIYNIWPFPLTSL